MGALGFQPRWQHRTRPGQDSAEGQMEAGSWGWVEKLPSAPPARGVLRTTLFLTKPFAVSTKPSSHLCLSSPRLGLLSNPLNLRAALVFPPFSVHSSASCQTL